MTGYLLAFFAAFSWGAAIVLSKESLNYLEPDFVFFIQICSAMLLSWGITLLTGKRVVFSKQACLAYSTGLLEPFLAYMLALFALTVVPAGMASVLFSFESVFIFILSIVILKNKIDRFWLFIVLLAASMVGSLIAIVPNINAQGSAAYGYVLVLLGVFSAALYVVLSSKLVESTDPLVLLTGQLTFATLLSFLFILSRHDSFPVLTHDAYLIIIVSGVLQYFLGFIFYLYSLKWVRVHIAGLFLYLIPAVALLLSWIFLQEKMTYIQLLGIVITITCIMVMNKKFSVDH